MKVLSIAGAILLVLGIALLFIPIPHKERHGFTAGPLSVGVETTERERVHPAISGALILGGVALIVTGARKRAG